MHPHAVTATKVHLVFISTIIREQVKVKLIHSYKEEKNSCLLNVNEKFIINRS